MHLKFHEKVKQNYNLMYNETPWRMSAPNKFADNFVIFCSWCKILTGKYSKD